MKKVLVIIAIIVGILILTVSLLSMEDTHVDPDSVVRDQPFKENRTVFKFPAEYQDFHKTENINYFLNRLYSFGYAPFDDMVIVGEKIGSIEDWKSEMLNLAEAAINEDRLLNASFYYRAAEFYTSWKDPDKKALYNKFIQYFYEAVKNHEFHLADVPYNDSAISVMKMNHTDKEYKGTIILHAGYDGFKEELFSIMLFLSTYGYDIISFDVPWMGRTNTSKISGFDYQWEKIIKSILDYYQLEDVTIFGISYGGWLALRAAAFESRIKRVISSSVSFDVNQYGSWLEQMISQFARKNLQDFANDQIKKQMESDPQMKWFFDHLMHVTNKSEPIDAANVLAQINEKNLHSDQVTQDVLILTGKDDHLVPFKMHNLQVKALKNAASVTPKVFTNEVQGHNHCQIGNVGLALSVVIDWLEDFS